MKLLTDFCVSQPIPLLGMTTEDKYVFNTHIYSSREFLFYLLYRCFMKVLNFRSNILAGKFPLVVFFETSLYSCSAHVPIFPCLSAPRKHTKHRFDFSFETPRFIIVLTNNSLLFREPPTFVFQLNTFIHLNCCKHCRFL